jgi:hypothetical protein
LLKEALKKGTADIFNCTMAGQQLSSKLLLQSLATSTYRILLSNQIYCVSSHHPEVKRAAINFLCDVNSRVTALQNLLELKQEIDRIRYITREVVNIAKEIDIDWSHIFLNDLEKINSKIEDDFSKACKVAESNFQLKSDKAILSYSESLRREFVKKRAAKSSLNIYDLKGKIESMDCRINDKKSSFTGLSFALIFSFVLIDFCLILFGALPVSLVNFTCRCDISNFYMFVFIPLVDIVYLSYHVMVFNQELSELTNERDTIEKNKNCLEFECDQITKKLEKLEVSKNDKIEQSKVEKNSEIRQEEVVRNRRISGIKGIENLLKEREKIHEFSQLI